MASSDSEKDDNTNDTGGPSTGEKRKRKIQRACDVCRRRKQRCNGFEMPNNRCSTCISSDLPCTYLESSKKRAPPKGYVESLESRLAQTEALLARVQPGIDIKTELGAPIDREQFGNGKRGTSLTFGNVQRPGHSAFPHASSSPVIGGSDVYLEEINNGFNSASPSEPQPGVWPGTQQLAASEETQNDDEAPLKAFAKISTKDEQLFKRFMGKSSSLPMLFSATGFKYFPEVALYGQDLTHYRESNNRTHFWRIPIWETTPYPNGPNSALTNPFAAWPQPDLAAHLIDLYFKHSNSLLPLLHRPTFQRQFASQLYNSDPGFARVCLLVFAVGAGYSKDPRVLCPGENGEKPSQNSAGWIYFHCHNRILRHRLAPTELWDLQTSVLLVQFLRYCSQPGSCWIIAGEGLKYAQDVGVHRKGVHRSNDEFENELYKRAFWCLYYLDREFSAILGRPFSIQDSDFDVGYPTDIDDQYWITTAEKPTFPTQPIGVPSRVTAFIKLLELYRILSRTISNLYNIANSFDKDQTHIEIALLDSLLDEWLNSMPAHLVWDQDIPDDGFYYQSSILYTEFYTVQTYVHRVRMPTLRKPVPASMTSFAVCVNAALSFCHVSDCMLKRTETATSFLISPTYNAAVILLNAYWGGRKAGLTSDPGTAMRAVEVCLAFMKEAEKIWFGVGRAYDSVAVLAAPLPDAQTRANFQPGWQMPSQIISHSKTPKLGPSTSSTPTMPHSASSSVPSPYADVGGESLPQLPLQNTSQVFSPTNPIQGVPSGIYRHAPPLQQQPLMSQGTFYESNNTDQSLFQDFSNYGDLLDNMPFNADDFFLEPYATFGGQPQPTYPHQQSFGHQ